MGERKSSQGQEGTVGAFLRTLHSIRTQYSLATAFFLMLVLGIFYVGGRIVLVHMVREAEMQVKEIGFKTNIGVVAQTL